MPGYLRYYDSLDFIECLKVYDSLPLDGVLTCHDSLLVCGCLSWLDSHNMKCSVKIFYLSFTIVCPRITLVSSLPELIQL